MRPLRARGKRPEPVSLRSATVGESMGLASCAACVLVLSICPMLVGSAVPGGAGAAGVRHWPATMLERILRDGACLPVLDRNSDGACAPGLRRTSTGTFEEPLLLRGGRDGAGMPEKDCFSPSRVPRPGPDLMWKQDVGERYRQLVPPRRPRVWAAQVPRARGPRARGAAGRVRWQWPKLQKSRCKTLLQRLLCVRRQSWAGHALTRW